MLESTCAEGNLNYFNQDVEPLPTAERPDLQKARRMRLPRGGGRLNLAP
jgi:hypothetical protein